MIQPFEYLKFKYLFHEGTLQELLFAFHSDLFRKDEHREIDIFRLQEENRRDCIFGFRSNKNSFGSDKQEFCLSCNHRS